MEERLPADITQRIKKEAELLATPERIDRIWRSISQRMDLEDARAHDKKTPRS